MNKFARNWDEAEKKIENELNKRGGTPADPRFYKPKFNKDGTFSALGRFLPAPGDETPIVKVFNHNFKGKSNLFFRDECPTTIGQPCPICNDNSDHWNAGDQQYARDHGRRKGAIINWYVINDPQSPECNGKVYLYRVGSKILERINEARKPSESKLQMGVKPVKVFDYYEGANFRLEGKMTVQKNGNKQPDYSDSKFDNPSQLGDDDMLGKIDTQLYSLKPFLDIGRFKSFDNLSAELTKVMGGKSQNNQPVQQPVSQAPSSVQPVIQPVQQPVNQQSGTPPWEPPVKVENKSHDVPLVDDCTNDEDEATFFSNIRKQQPPK